MYDGRKTAKAREMRKNMTDAEAALWKYLRRQPVHFYRQRVIGPFIADFYCPKLKLCIEADGAQHRNENGIAYDTERDTYFKGREITVLRFSNQDIKYDFPKVCSQIAAIVQSAVSRNRFCRGEIHI